jgi:tetratricopeptide (TPR) repeat protein
MSDNPFADRFPELQPGRRPGGLGVVNGFGTRLMGHRDFDAETGTYVVTHVLVLLFIPVCGLGAYRVAQAPGGGWYCLGRVPLSAVWRGWNVFLVLALLAGGVGIWWNQHTKSPEYVAGQKLKRADEAAAAGKGGEAARLCREVMDSKTSRAEEAGTKLAGFIANPPGAPGEAAAVYEVALELHRENRCPVDDLFGTGKALVEKHAADDPGAALALLEVIAPFAKDVAAELNLRLTLLEALRAKNPDDPETAARLAAAYAQKGDLTKSEQLLVPFEARLGTSDGAALLGRLYAARGQFDKAHALLAPFVAARLPEYQGAIQAVQSARAGIIATWKTGKAPGFDYERFQRAGEAQQQEMVLTYIDTQLKNDPAVREADRKLKAGRGIPDAVLNLGVVQLQRAQGLTDPVARKAGLEAAEKTFLSIQSVAGERAGYRLSLGQVYYWLGRAPEGKKLFDELLTEPGKTTETVLAVAHGLREVGETAEARRLAEDAYNKETDTKLKYRAAQVRGLLFIDLDDEIQWLGRCDPNDPENRARLALTRGNKARRDGKDDEAAEQFQQALAVYAQMPENSGTLNNCALVHFALFEVTLDHDEFTRGSDKLDRAIALDPTSTISLLNGTGAVAESAARETVGTEIDFRALKGGEGAWAALVYLYRTPAERAAVAARFAKHPGAVKARGYSEKLLLLAPKRGHTYQMFWALCASAEDTQGLKVIAAKAAKAQLDVSEDERRHFDFLTGKSDAKKTAEAKATTARAETALAAGRAVGGRTFALAVGRYVGAKTGGWVYGLPVSTDELVKLADEAHAAAPSAGTEATLTTALQFRAHLALCAADPGYAAAAKKTQRSFGVGLLYHVLATDTPLRAKIVQNADVKRLAALVEEEFRRDPDRATASDWVLLRAVGSAQVPALAEKVKASERNRAHRELARALSPFHASTAMEEYRNLLLEGKEAEAKAALDALAKKGVPVP